jgi:hypothetical protein
MSDSEHWSIFPITDNLSSSLEINIDKLIYYDAYKENRNPIGMSNFSNKLNRSVSEPVKNTLYNHINCVATSPAILHWRSAVSKVKFMIDPWCEFKLHKYPAERAIRHRYNAIKKQWIKDECIVKMEPEQFSNGAMRACFRL